MTALSRFLAWAIALTLLALPVIGLLNGWFARERWPVRHLAVQAPFDHVSAEQVRAAVQPLLGQGFFALPLQEVRDALAALPWVERVEARKRWPDVLELVLYEQQPYARWGEDRLVNRSGRLFSVMGSGAPGGLPQLSGPDERLAEVIAFHLEVLRALAGSGLVLEGVALSPRGGWTLQLASGARIHAGRDQPLPRLQRFLDVWPRLAEAGEVPLASADLRYENGFALRWAEPDQDEPGGAPGDGPAPHLSPNLLPVAP